MFHGMGKRKKLTNSYYLPEGSINAPNESKDVDKVRHGFTGHEYSNGAKNGGGKFGANVPRASPPHYITTIHCDDIPGDGKPRIARHTYIIYIDAYYNPLAAT